MNLKTLTIQKTFISTVLLLMFFTARAQTDSKLSAFSDYTLKSLSSGTYSKPVWSPNGQYIAFTNNDMSGIYVIKSDGSEIKTLTKELGAGYKFSWSEDNSHIIYRGSRFEGNKRTQFIGLVDIARQSDEIISMHNRLQPPAWQYKENGKQIIFFVDDMLTNSDIIPYSDSKCEVYKIQNANTFFYYKNGHIHLITEGVKTVDEASAIKGMDPVISPDKKTFVYALNDHLYLRFFDNDKQIDLGKGSHPSWSPKGDYVVYQITTDDGHQITGSDLYILNIENFKSFKLTNTTDVFEVNPCWGPDGQHIVFNDELSGHIYLISFN